jgi:hypothetical protein
MTHYAKTLMEFIVDKIISFIKYALIVTLSTLGTAVVLYESWATMTLLVKMITQ